MQERTLGLTALAVASVAIGLYSLVAGMALLLGGSLGTFAGSDAGVAVMVLGALMFGAGTASFFVGYAFWMKRSWAWAGGIVVAAVIVVTVLVMGLIGASYTSLILPVVLGLSLIWYLLRPSVRAQFTRSETSTDGVDETDPEATRGRNEVAMESPA